MERRDSIIFLILCLFLLPARANSDEEDGNNKRSISHIITVCTATLFLSVFTALHLNVNPSKSPWRRAAKKLRWVLCALTAPEYLVYMAFIEWRVSRRICRE